MKILKNWQLQNIFDQGVTLLVEHKHLFTIFVLDDKMMRVVIQKNGEFELDRTWSIAPNQDVPLEGRDRLSLDGFNCPKYHLEHTERFVALSTQTLKVVITHPLMLTWYYRESATAEWMEIAQDRSTSAYQLGRHHYTEIAHYQKRYGDERFYGLGEKAGPLERTHKKYEMRNLDAMGYDAEHTDPLYKHIPFTITHRQGLSFGMFYDNLSTCQLDLGNELDNYHPKYRKYVAESGDLDYYFFVGPKIIDVTQTIVRLTGKTIFPPKWSLGYSGSTMSYTDAPDAQNKLHQFLDLCTEHKIPCDSFQMSSGYTSIGDKRYVFNWNTEKFPNIHELTKCYQQAGIQLIANIKPCLLVDHPQYEFVKAQNWFVQDSEVSEPEISVFWDADGSHIDFTHPEAFNWWQENVTEQLLKKGIASTWNDNNEYEIWDRDAKCHGFGRALSIKNIRPVMPLLMMRASKEAQEKYAPKLRPYLISRSGCLGMQRYVQTWSGDNRTSWHSLKFNIKMGLGMSMSGLYNIGHDVGGFAGEKPDPELFVRWVQNGIMHPRFTIHSWNDDHTANEPWMYADVLPYVRSAINLRYELMPYFYTLLWRAHVHDEPMIRPTLLNYEHDLETFKENDDFLLGNDILVASVVEPNATTRSVYLPDEMHGWYDFYTHTWHKGAQYITLDAPLERLPLLVKGGVVLPTSDYIGAVANKHTEQLTLKLFPHPKEGVSDGVIFDDDGVSHDWKMDDQYLMIHWTMTSTEERINLTLQASGKFIPTNHNLICQLPKQEQRNLYINGVPSLQWSIS